MGQNDNSDPYAIQEPRQVPYTNPYDIPRGNNPNDYVYKNVAPKVNADPYAKTWTDEQKARKQLQDAINARKKLEQSFVGMPTTEVVVKLGEHDDTIQRLSQQLGVGDRTSTQNVAAPMSAPESGSYSGDNSGHANVGGSLGTKPVGQSFADDVVDRAGAEPFGQTFTDDVVNQAGAEPLGQMFTGDVVDQVGAAYQAAQAENGEISSKIAEYNSQIEELKNRIELINGSMDNSYAFMMHGGLSGDEYAWHKINYNNGFDQLDLIKEEINEIEKERDRLDHAPTIAQKVDETEDMINIRQEEGKPPYEAYNTTDVSIDEETINNIVIIANSEYGAFSERYQKEYDAGNIEIRINDYKEHEFSQDEAVELYFEEQASRNEAVSTIIGALSAKGDLTKTIVYIGNELLQGNSMTEELFYSMVEDLEVGQAIKDGIKGFAVEKGVELFLNTLDSMNYIINNIEGGNYIDVKWFSMRIMSRLYRHSCSM